MALNLEELLKKDISRPGLVDLKGVRNRADLAKLIGVELKFLTYVLYALRPENSYYQFQIKKKSGGHRTINAPSEPLLQLQKKLARVLQNCLEDILEKKGVKIGVSHGFMKGRSILTNARKHRNSKNVMNLDLSGFFPSIHFGRVKSFFEKNNNFKLDSSIATIVSQIACYESVLPQGSPCSPVISNLICSSLDARLVYLANKYDCVYTRYADDITLSTNEKEMPEFFVGTNLDKKYTVSSELEREINNYRFSVNHNKTRVQYSYSRQEVTGIVVNRKLGVKKEYWQAVRQKCHRLFMTGVFHESDGSQGSVSTLEGQLNFIDQIDKYNRIKTQFPSSDLFEEKKFDKFNPVLRLNIRETVFAKFLFYKNFYANDRPVILTEGKTDHVYIREAVRALKNSFPRLMVSDSVGLSFLKGTKRNRFFFNYYNNGYDCLVSFLRSAGSYIDFFGPVISDAPVVFVMDNDSGAEKFLNAITSGNCGIANDELNKNGDKQKAERKKLKEEIRSSGFIRIGFKFYLVLTPNDLGRESQIEDLFSSDALSIKLGGRSFSAKNDFDKSKFYGKDDFANKVIKKKRGDIYFDGFKPLLKRIDGCIKDCKKHAKALNDQRAEALAKKYSKSKS